MNRVCGIGLAAVFSGFLGQAVWAQEAVDAFRCAAYFQARATWVATLEGEHPRGEMWGRYGRRLLVAAVEGGYVTQRDCEMFTGTRPRGCAPGAALREEVLRVLTRFAQEQAAGRLALCMEDAQCVACTETLRAVVRP